MTRTTLLTSIVALTFALGFTTFAYATPTETVTNGDFETGDLTGWTEVLSGCNADWLTNDGTLNPFGPTGLTAPITGNFDAVNIQSCNGEQILLQEIVVPVNIISADMSWNDRIISHAVLSDPNQEARMEIRDAAGTTVLAEIFSTNNGDVAIQNGPNARAFDVTSTLQALEGQTVTLAFDNEVRSFFSNWFVDDVSLLIETNQAPECSNAEASVSSIWPPNHKMKDVTVLEVADADGDSVTITIDGITQDEPVNETGDGDTSPDGDGVGTDTAQVRAERSGTGDGRVYDISFTADDGNGGTCSGSVEVGVPHDKKDTAIRDWASFDSTTP